MRRAESTPKTTLMMALVAIVLVVSCGSPAQPPSEPQSDLVTGALPTSNPNPTPLRSTTPILPTPTATPSPTATPVPNQLVPTQMAQSTSTQTPSRPGTPIPTRTLTPTPTIPIEKTSTVGTPSPTSESILLSVNELIKQTRDEDWKNRWDAVNELGIREDPRGIPALAERALYDDNSHPRWRSLWALAAIERDGVAVKPILISGLDDPDPVVVRNAAVALSFFGFGEAKQELLNGLSDSDNYRRWEAVFSLRELSGPDVVAALLPLLDPTNEPADNVRSEVALTLGRIGGVEVAPRLLEVLKTDPVPGVRMRAALSLSRLADSTVVEELNLVLLTEESEQVRKIIQDTVDDFKQDE